MGLPMFKVKDPTRRLPLKPLTVYVLADEYEADRREEKFYEITSRPPFSLLPVDFVFVVRTHRYPMSEGSIFTQFGDNDIIVRDVEVEYSTDNLKPEEYSVSYNCGKIDWSLSFGLEMGLEIILYELFSDIIQLAHHVKMMETGRMREIAEELIAKFENAKSVLNADRRSSRFMSSPEDIGKYEEIEHLRSLLNETTIIRDSPEEWTEDDILESLSTGRIKISDYYIVLRRTRSGGYRIFLRVGSAEYPLGRKDLSVQLYLYAIAFTIKGTMLRRDFLKYDISNPHKTEEEECVLHLLCSCHQALQDRREKSISFRDDLYQSFEEDSPFRLILELPVRFIDDYKRMTHSNGRYDSHLLTKLQSRLNNTLISDALSGYPEEVQEIFRLKYDQDSREYCLDIPRENIIVY